MLKHVKTKTSHQGKRSSALPAIVLTFTFAFFVFGPALACCAALALAQALAHLRKVSVFHLDKSNLDTDTSMEKVVESLHLSRYFEQCRRCW